MKNISKITPNSPGIVLLWIIWNFKETSKLNSI